MKHNKMCFHLNNKKKERKINNSIFYEKKVLDIFLISKQILHLFYQMNNYTYLLENKRFLDGFF